jgi:hypothetical protein
MAAGSASSGVIAVPIAANSFPEVGQRRDVAHLRAELHPMRASDASELGIYGINVPPDGERGRLLTCTLAGNQSSGTQRADRITRDQAKGRG